ncbi:MAG TPA: preprotein translocase subunit SecE, partial [Planctomycetota bacterium]|nr:preprotein translocase subunit SecE [Planctomycetota bacterium]
LAPVPGGSFQVHKPGEGYATRLGMMVIVMAYTAFACHHFYYNWVWLRNFVDGILSSIWLGWMVSWTYDLTAAKIVAMGGTLLIAAVGFFVGYYFIYLKRSTAEFLIKTDVELSKVTWPKISPWFKMDTQVWGATYVVLIVVAALTLYVFGVDLILNQLAQWLFYSSGSRA